jgi:glycosyltransferase involved in cell wall biosynthesis
MRVGFMGRSIRPGATGVGRYAANLVGALSRQMPSGTLSVFVTRDAARRWNGSVKMMPAPFPTPNEYARALWEQTVVPAQAAALGCDVYHSPSYIVPSALTCPSVVSVHDLAYLRRHLHRLTSHVYLSALTALALRRASAVVAVSQHTRRLIEARYPHTRGRVEVVYEGVDPALEPPSPAALRAFRDRVGLADPYVLFVGTQEPRKNLARLVRAYERAVDRTGLPHRLVLVGPRGWKTEDFEIAVARSPLRDRIVRPGFAPDHELACWYAGAALFVYPSLEEGFGLPALEAMACGAPVLVSNTSSLPEVVGDAGLTADPEDVDALAEAMARVLTDRPLAERMVHAGRRRAERFTWDEAARQHIAIYRRVCAKGGHT